MTTEAVNRRLPIILALGLNVMLLLALQSVTLPPVPGELEAGPRYSSAQVALLWGQKVSGSQSTDSVEALDLDAYGNTYACGYFYGTATFGSITLSGQGQDGFVGKIDPSGNWVWVQKMGGSSSDQCKDIDVDDGGNISITGYFYSTAAFGSTYLSSLGAYDIFVAKLDTNGTWLWATKAGGNSNDYGYGVAMDNNGRVYITGYYYSSGTIYFGSFTLATYSYDEAFVAALDQNGQFIWAQRMYGSYYQRGRGIDVNDNGEIAVTGEFSYRINMGGSCGELSPSYQSSNYYRIFVARYTSSGNCLWARMAGYLQSSYSSYGEDVAISNNGEVAIVGRFQYLVDFQTNGNNRLFAYQNANNWDCLVAKYASSGGVVWAQAVGGSSTDYCYSLDMDRTSGNITIAGMYQGTAWFGNTYIASRGGSDAFYATLTPDPQNPSAYIWSTIHHFGGTSSDYGWAVAARNGTVAYGGYFYSSAYDDANQVTLNSIGGYDGFLLIYGVDSDGDGVGDGTDVFPNEPSQWADRDGDGFGDNLTGLNGDDCPDTIGNSTGGEGLYGCPDRDGDGWADSVDMLPDEPTQWVDTDNDGFGNNMSGYQGDACPMMWGNSWRDQYGCLDLDGDGQSFMNDNFPSKNTQWNDTDGDGSGDNWADKTWNVTRPAHWPGEWIAGAWQPDPSPLDWDDDGYEDGVLEGASHPWDDCVYEAGDSWRNLIGCPDSDGDGWSDINDEVDDNPSQHEDHDGDGFGDSANGSMFDDCPTRWGNSTIDRFGCPDNDGDGLSNDNDDCPTVAGLPSNGCPDRDGDGYVDQADESDDPVDDCPDDFGTSHIDRYGCPDGDGDGWSDANDPFPDDGTQWEDSDGDGYGDNPDGEMADDCPSRAGQSSQGGVLGCEDWDLDGWADHIDPYPQNASMWSDGDGDGFADQQGTNISDNCPLEWGNSTYFRRGCPDMDGDGVPDNLDFDIDGDGYPNTDEMRSDPPSDPYDSADTPANLDGYGRGDNLEGSEISSSSLMQDTFGKVVTGAVLLLVVFAVVLSFMMVNTNTGRRNTFGRLEKQLFEAEGFDGLAEIEEELEELLRRGSISGSQGMLMRQQVDEKRYALDEELRVSQQAQWWAAMGQQNQQQWGGWYPTTEQAQWYAGQQDAGQYDQYGGQQ